MRACHGALLFPGGCVTLAARAARAARALNRGDACTPQHSPCREGWPVRGQASACRRRRALCRAAPLASSSPTLILPN